MSNNFKYKQTLPTISPPKKRQRISKHSSKKPTQPPTISPNSHITITFANIGTTIDAIILPKQNVLAITTDVLIENKGKLSIKKSDPIQNDIAPEIPINIQTLTAPNIKTIHDKNSFRMGTCLFYCSDEQRLFWAFPLRQTRRVACQHYCCAVNRIITRSVGIYSNACNGDHPTTISCVYAVCNGKPAKGSIPAKLVANYQYFQHSAKTQLLVLKDPIPKPNIQDKKNQLFTDSGEPVPFQQNVQINLKALKQTLNRSASNMTEPEAHNYDQLLVSSTRQKCKDLLLNGKFDEVIVLLKPLIEYAEHWNDISNEKLNEYRLLMATALYYKEDKALVLHLCELILANCKNNIQCYEARKLRGLINKDLNNYQAACHDFEFICHNSPYQQTWIDKMYLNRPNRSMQCLTHQPSINYNVWQNNNNYYQHPQINMSARRMDIANPNAPIVFVPPIMDRKSNKPNAMLDINSRFNEQAILSASVGGLNALRRKTTREELLDEQCMLNLNSSNEYDGNSNLCTNIESLDRTVNTTPEPLEQIRSDALMN